MSQSIKKVTIGSNISTSQLNTQIANLKKTKAVENVKVENVGGKRQIVMETSGVGQAMNAASNLSNMVKKIDPNAKVSMQRTSVMSGGQAGAIFNKQTAKPAEILPQIAREAGGVAKLGGVAVQSGVLPSSIPANNVPISQNIQSNASNFQNINNPNKDFGAQELKSTINQEFNPPVNTATTDQFMKTQVAPVERMDQRAEMVGLGQNESQDQITTQIPTAPDDGQISLGQQGNLDSGAITGQVEVTNFQPVDTGVEINTSEDTGNVAVASTDASPDS